MLDPRRWIPAGLLIAGCFLNGAIVARRSGPVPLRGPLTGVARTLLGVTATDDTVSTDVRQVAGMTSYVMRTYQPVNSVPFGVYIGYYDEQRQGKSIHSPKNCLPGDGWEPVESGVATIPTSSGMITVNRYRVAKPGVQALVYYWYQGRGRVAHNEWRVKFELLRDAALHGRTEEALVRIVVPVTGTDVSMADSLARAVAPTLVSDLDRVLPVP
ncbi:MAG: exosortase C-terminal domain/associated protein EpsI [Gemmatimonadales bacterium]